MITRSDLFVYYSDNLFNVNILTVTIVTVLFDLQKDESQTIYSRTKSIVYIIINSVVLSKMSNLHGLHDFNTPRQKALPYILSKK